MAKGFKQGTSGTPLNFKVVGNPQPVNPKENTIWVDTDVPITGYCFIASEPTNPTKGIVWIRTGKYSHVNFNALKKNAAQIYPAHAMQYIDGAWVDRNAMIFQNGNWVNFGAYLYNHGDECKDITGGWSAFVGHGDSSTKYSLGTFTKNINSMTLAISGTKKCTSAAPTNKIDLTDVSELIVVVDSGDNGRVDITSYRSEQSDDSPVARQFLSEGTNFIDLSNVTGSYYVVITLNSYYQADYSTTISEVRIA